MANVKPTFIDLFCGCGGFSLGLVKAGWKCLAGIDFNKEAIQVFKANFPEVENVHEVDLTEFPPELLQKRLAKQKVDLIVGGPPCQGFSHARQVDGANHGPRLVEDSRRYLYQEFLKYVAHFRPKVFVMENVLGIRSSQGGEYFTRVQAESRKLGYTVISRLEDASKLGVPQMRRRQLFFGIREDIASYFPRELTPAKRAILGVKLGDAIMDLPELEAGEGSQEAFYDRNLRKSLIRGNKHHFIYRVLEVHKANMLTAHVARPHNARDLGDFAKLKEGQNSGQLMRNGVQFDFPYDRRSFTDRYTRQHRKKLCSTIVAHLAKDGLMFIHPTQLRSLTPREAARVQTFPDTFNFPVARSHQFRVIGNAVPPLIGEAVGETILRFLEDKDLPKGPTPMTLPTGRDSAESMLVGVCRLSKADLKRVSVSEIVMQWQTLLYFFPHLHPENALDHGVEKAKDAQWMGSKIFDEYYLRSGWPVKLEAFGQEVWRRYGLGAILENTMFNEKVLKLGKIAKSASSCELSSLSNESDFRRSRSNSA